MNVIYFKKKHFKKMGHVMGQMGWVGLGQESSKIVNGRVHTNKIVTKFFKYHVF